MAKYSANPTDLDALASQLESTSTSLAGWKGDVEAVDTTGWDYTIWWATAELSGASSWATAWAASLRDRANTLRMMERVRLGGPGSPFDSDQSAWIYGSTNPFTFVQYTQDQFDAEVTAYNQRVADLEAEIAAGPGEQIYFGIPQTSPEELLRIVQATRYRDLEQRVADAEPGSLEWNNYIDHLRDVANDLGLETEGFEAAAHTMTEGIAPSNTDLDELYFPPWYVTDSEEHARLEAELAGVNDTQPAPGRGNRSAYRAWQQRQEEAEDALDDHGFEPPGHGDVVAWLDELFAVPRIDQHTLVGEYLASEITEAGGNDVDTMHELSNLVDMHVGHTDEATAMFNAMEPQALAQLTNPHWNMTFGSSMSNFEFMQPFADAMAVASGNENLHIDLETMLNQPESALWFAGGQGYDTDFLIEAGTTVTNIDGFDWWQRDDWDPQGNEYHLDPRVYLFTAIAEMGQEESEALLQSIVDNGTLGNFLDPDQHWADYVDGGNAAGAVLAQLGQDDSESSALLMIEVMQLIGEDGGPSGVLQGSSVMIAPHLGSLSDEHRDDTIPITALHEILLAMPQDQKDALIHEFLGTTMEDDLAAQNIWNAFAGVMTLAVNGEFDPNDTDGHAEAFGESGRLLDMIVSAHLDMSLEEARDTDQFNGIMQGIISTVIDLSAAVLLLGSGGLAGFLYGAAVSIANNNGSGFALEFVLPTDNAEGVLEGGYVMENGLVHNANMLLALLLHQEGALELPADWFQDGTLQPITPAQWEDFSRELEATDFEYYEWFNDSASIGGWLDWAPSD